MTGGRGGSYRGRDHDLSNLEHRAGLWCVRSVFVAPSVVPFFEQW